MLGKFFPAVGQEREQGSPRFTPKEPGATEFLERHSLVAVKAEDPVAGDLVIEKRS